MAADPPDVRDGLTVDARHALLGLRRFRRPGGGYKKSAAIVNETMLHRGLKQGHRAHYRELVRLAQPFATRAPLVDLNGNGGSIDADPPASMPYTEMRLSALGKALVGDVGEHGSDPAVLPGPVPNLLINGSPFTWSADTIGVPPHAPAEVCAAALALLDDPHITDEALMEHLPAPDFPLCANLTDRSQIRQIYTTGAGPLTVRATCRHEHVLPHEARIAADTQYYTRWGPDGDVLVVEDLPPLVRKGGRNGLLQELRSIRRHHKEAGLTDVEDHSDWKRMRVIIELRDGTDPLAALIRLRELTSLERTFSVEMRAIIDGTARTLTLRELLVGFLDHQVARIGPVALRARLRETSGLHDTRRTTLPPP